MSQDCHTPINKEEESQNTPPPQTENVQNKTPEKIDKVGAAFSSNFLFGSMMVLTFIGTGMLIYNISNFRDFLINNNPSYNFPKLADLHITATMFPIIIVKYILN
jgi:hypothetical protein